MNRLFLCHQHNSMFTHKFLTHYVIPEASKYGFNVFLSEAGDYDEVYKIDKMCKNNITNIFALDNSESYEICKKEYEEKYVLGNFLREEMYPKLLDLEYNIKSIRFFDGHTADEVFEDRNLAAIRDTKMFERIFKSDLDEKALVYISARHCNMWNNKGWIDSEALKNTKFLVMADESNRDFCIKHVTKKYAEDIKKTDIYTNHLSLLTETEVIIGEEQLENKCIQTLVETLPVWNMCLEYIRTDYSHTKCIWSDFNEAEQIECLGNTFSDIVNPLA